MRWENLDADHSTVTIISGPLSVLYARVKCSQELITLPVAADSLEDRFLNDLVRSRKILTVDDGKDTVDDFCQYLRVVCRFNCHSL